MSWFGGRAVQRFEPCRIRVDWPISDLRLFGTALRLNFTPLGLRQDAISSRELVPDFRPRWIALSSKFPPKSWPLKRAAATSLPVSGLNALW